MEAAQRAAGEFRSLFGKPLTKAVAIFDAGFTDALAFLRFPLEHHRSIATTKAIEHLTRKSAGERARLASSDHANPPCVS